MLTGEAFLPVDDYQFQDTLRSYFPHILDVKTMAAPWSHLQGGLSKLCMELGIKRIGTQHQAGSDSLITAAAYFKLKELYYPSKGKSSTTTGLESVKNMLFGIDPSEESWDCRYYTEYTPYENIVGYSCCNVKQKPLNKVQKYGYIEETMSMQASAVAN